MRARQWKEDGAVGADLRISYTDLESTQARMQSLVKDFQDIETDQSKYDGAMGSGDVAGAMDSFAGNWSVHRKKILAKMQNLNSMVQAALVHFPKTDQDLASKLTKH